MSSAASRTGTTTLARGRSSSRTAGRSLRVWVRGSRSAAEPPPARRGPAGAPAPVVAPVPVAAPAPVAAPVSGGAIAAAAPSSRSELAMPPVPVDGAADSLVQPDLRREAETLARAIDRVDAVLRHRAHARAGERRGLPERCVDGLQERPQRHRRAVGKPRAPDARAETRRDARGERRDGQ